MPEPAVSSVTGFTGASFDQVGPGFRSDAANFSRTTTLSYTYADLLPSVLWLAALLHYAPVLTVFLPGLVTGSAAVLIDYVWFYRSGRREVLVDGAAAGPAFIALWLVCWFDFLIAFNIGTFVGFMLHVGLRSEAGVVGATAFVFWFWVLTPTLARVIADLGFGRALITTTRRVGGKLSRGRVGAALVLHGVVYFGVLAPDAMRAAELFGVGVLAGGGMEVPLYMLGIRPGRDAWKALVLNTLFEWNYAVPVFFLVLRALGRLP